MATQLKLQAKQRLLSAPTSKDMKTYKITYYAPYTSAEFTCKARTIEEARKKRDAFNDKEGFRFLIVRSNLKRLSNHGNSTPRS